MKRFFRFIASAMTVSLALGALPALAQYATEYTPAKLLKQGTTTQSIAGSGTVVVQVQVNANGTHKAIRVIKSSNSGDNAAALEIAQNSTYRPAHRGTTAVTAFYDFTLKFNGKFVAQSSDQGAGAAGPAAVAASSPAARKIAALIAGKQYAAAKSQAQSDLQAAPGDDEIRQLLGVAAFDAGDPLTAAQAFDVVSTVGAAYQPIAVASFAAAAVQVSQTNPTQSLAYAQKAFALSPDTNTRFALGVAQLSNKQYADAVTNLKAAHDAAMNDPHMTAKVKINIDSMLLSAYADQKDTADVATIAAEIKALDPTSTAASRALANSEFQAGVEAAGAKNFDEALKDFDEAAAEGDPHTAVTAYVQAAFTIANMEHPDYKRMLAYADKAIALDPNDAGANYADGFALTATGGDKDKALAALQKADAQAKQDGDATLASAIEKFMKDNNLGSSGH